MTFWGLNINFYQLSIRKCDSSICSNFHEAFKVVLDSNTINQFTMKSILLLSSLLLFATHLKAQDISKQVIGASGETLTNTSYILAFTVGESIVGKIQNNVTLGQGFWSVLQNEGTLGINTDDEIMEHIQIYPNPVRSYLNINVHNTLDSNVSISLYDLNGKLIMGKEIYATMDSRLDMTKLSHGLYFLTIKTLDNQYNNTIKIIKQ